MGYLDNLLGKIILVLDGSMIFNISDKIKYEMSNPLILNIIGD